ncbi:MAG: TIGR03032 family protein [Synechococcales cyanobacterium C42_A2020_086]|jgi:uncharacterized protein (TIGR03032 family)|nr:TIGR03032 family protein [Synechococcales cyanobacterium C42_A2020_086]
MSVSTSPLPSDDAQHALQQIAQLGQAGQFIAAASLCQQVLQQHPTSAQAWHLMSLIHLQQGQIQLALDHIERAIALDPQVAEFHSHAGVIRCSLGDLETGLVCYQQALALQPDSLPTRYNLGLALQKAGRWEDAMQVYLLLIAQQPTYAAAHYQLGNVCQQQHNLSAAIAHYRQAIQLQPQLAEAWYNLGVALQSLGEWLPAQDAYQQALQLNPQYVEAHNGLGTLYEKQGQVTTALHHYQQALALQPDYLPALANLGTVQLRLDQLPAAESTYRSLLQRDPDSMVALDSLVKLRLRTGNWTDLSTWTDRLRQRVQQALQQQETMRVSPLNTLYLPFSAAEQQAIAASYAQEIQRRMAAVPPLPPAVSASPRPLRLGYVSGDFRCHAVGQLILHLFELHDRQNFVVFAYSLGPEDGSSERQKLRADCDVFRDFQGWSPAAMATQIRQDQIDILIDLTGYTDYACPELFALRPAPVQVNYLGYPGTLGADYIDYIITDAVITPPELAGSLSERCLYLPHTYQLNSYRYTDAPPLLMAEQQAELRATYELPTNAVIFCCFNKSQKIEPIIFAAWMRILSQVPSSVLWLLSDRPETATHLRATAASHGIDPQRLIFAPRLPKAEHLQRQACADLFLDTLYYNAHVTGSDALWSGVPLLTVLGQTFASRVAASLLTAAGLPELIAPSLAAYEQHAVYLATHPAELHALRQRLADQRLHCPLFDTERTVRHLEAGYRLIWEQYLAGDSASSLQVPVQSLGQAAAAPTPSLHGPVRSSSTPVVSELLSCTADEGFINWLSQAAGSLLITTYQAGKVLLVGWNGQQVTLLARQFTKPMGVALAGDRLALTTKHEVLLFANARPLAASYLDDQPGRYDALYLPRSTYFTGDLNFHDIAFGEAGLWLVNTRFSCLATLSPDFSFVPRWHPAFISELAPEDRCHLNGLAMVAGQPKYVTALGETDTVGGWRTTQATGGILIDVDSDEILLRGLSMPHSPRWYRDRLWLLNSGTGALWQVNPATGETQEVCALPGFGRGLSLVGNHALVGLSQMRERQIFGALPLQERFPRLICGVAVVDLSTGAVVGQLEFPSGCQELYDVKFLPGIYRPSLLSPSQPASREAFTAPEFAYWLRPSSRLA